MRARTHEFGKKVFTEIPAEIVRVLGVRPGDELEFFPAYKNVVVVAPIDKEAGGQIPAATENPRELAARAGKAEDNGTAGLAEKEIGVLRKVNAIKYYDRTMENIQKNLSKEEKEILNGLIMNKIVFRYVKNKKELFGISREFFKLVEAGKEIPNFEYAVLNYEGEASEVLKKTPKVKAVRGFDKKFYLIREDLLRNIEQKFEKTLKKEKGICAIAAELKIDEGLCRAAIENLKEEGTIIEKKKDTYALA